MFKPWSKKKKVKTLFKLEFQAIQVPKLKKSALMISLVPEDVGKPTVRLQKAVVQDGTCSWEDPIYETVKFISESKTGKIKEKIYHFIVSTGSSKSGYLGEASVDLADFVEQTKPFTISLPLKFANSGAVLHVTIQKIEEDNDQKYVEENGVPFLSPDESLRNELGNCSQDDLYSFSDNHLSETPSEIAESNGVHHKPPTFPSHIRRFSIPETGFADAITPKNPAHRRSNTYCSVDSTSDGSLVDSINSFEDGRSREKSREASEGSMEKLRTEIAALMRQAEVSEMELQSLRKQLVKERKQGENLSRQIVCLKEENDSLELECEQLKSLQKHVGEAEDSKRLRSEIIDTRVQLEEMRQELNYEKQTSKDLQLQLQKTQDLNSKLICAVRDLEDMLERKNREISDISSSKINEDENPEALAEPDKEHDVSKEVDLLKDNIRDLNGEIDFYKKYKEELDLQMKQVTSDYDLLMQENQEISLKLEESQAQQQMTQNEFAASLATIKELESLIQRLDEKIKKQAEELSESLLSINELEGQVEGLEKELEKQAQTFEEDLNAMTCAKTEQEQRAIQAEEALRKTRRNSAVATDRLQDEFRTLSVEMASKLDEHEKQAKEALAEASELRQQNRTLEELVQKANEELRIIKDQNQVKQQELLDQIHLNEKQVEKISLELEQTSKQLEYAKMHETEHREAFSLEIQMLKAEVQRLTKEKYDFPEQSESAQFKTWDGEREMLLQTWNKERDDLMEKLASAKKETEKINEEFISMRSLKDEKETANYNLLSEVEKLRACLEELKQNMDKEYLEKKTLREQTLELKHQLEEKEEEITSIEKKLVNYNGQSEERENGRKNRIDSKRSVPKGTSIQKKDTAMPHERFSSEMASLKERNERMEKELKDLHERYSEISLRFAEVEGERQQLVMTVRNLKNSKKI